MNNSFDQRTTVLKSKAEEIARKLMKAEDQFAPTFAKPIPQPAPKSNIDPSEYRIFVKNLRAETTEETLKHYFERWGKVKDVYIRQSKFRYAGQSCNMAYITYSSFYYVSPVNCCMHVIDGFTVSVSTLQPKPNQKYDEVSATSKTIMITGTIQDLKDDDLVEFFSTFGELAKLTRKRDVKDNKKFQRYAFVVFANPKSVDKIMALDKLVLKGQVIDARRVKDLA